MVSSASLKTLSGLVVGAKVAGAATVTPSGIPAFVTTVSVDFAPLGKVVSYFH